MINYHMVIRRCDQGNDIKKALIHNISAVQGKLTAGAEGEIRTRTTVGHYPLKIACLPIPPLRHPIFYLCCYSALGASPGVATGSCVSAAGAGMVIGALSAAGAGTVAC